MAEKTDYTKGPWHVDRDGWIVGKDENFSICLIDGSRELDEFDHVDKANAKLICAAPEMVEAIERTIAALEAEFGNYKASVTFPYLYDVLAKAVFE